MRKTSAEWCQESFLLPRTPRHYLWRYFVNCFEVSHIWHIVWMAGCVVVSMEIQISSHVIAKLQSKSKKIKKFDEPREYIYLLLCMYTHTLSLSLKSTIVNWNDNNFIVMMILFPKLWIGPPIDGPTIRLVCLLTRLKIAPGVHFDTRILTSLKHSICPTLDIVDSYIS